MRIDDDFEVVEVKVFRLVRRGRTVIDERGNPVDYESLVDAIAVAVNWDRHRMPTYSELEAMSDEDIYRRIANP